MKISSLLFSAFIVSIAANMCAVDVGESQLFVALLHEEGLLTRPADDTEAQKVSALGLLKELDAAHENKDVAKAEGACRKFSLLGAMDWHYLAAEQQVLCLTKEHQAQHMIKKLKQTSVLKSLLNSNSTDERRFDTNTIQWLTDCINQGLCGDGSEVWKDFGGKGSKTFPALKQLNNERIEYLKCAGKPQEMAE